MDPVQLCTPATLQSYVNERRASAARTGTRPSPLFSALACIASAVQGLSHRLETSAAGMDVPPPAHTLSTGR